MSKRKAISRKAKRLALAGLAVVLVLATVLLLAQKPQSQFDGKPSSSLLAQMLSEGFCAEAYPRSYYEKDLDYLQNYDQDTVRACSDGEDGGLVYIITDLEPPELYELRQSAKSRSAYGRDWMIVCMSGGDKSSFVQQVASRFGGKFEVN